MNNISRTLKCWVQNGNMTLDDMARKVFERGWGEYRVLTYDELKENISCSWSSKATVRQSFCNRWKKTDAQIISATTHLAAVTSPPIPFTTSSIL